MTGYFGLQRTIRSLCRAAVIRDSGYRRCLLCGAETFMGQRVDHRKRCPVRKAKEQEQACRNR